MSDSCEHQKQSANRRNHQKFPGKLWRLVHSCKSGAIRWGYRGNSVIINAVRFRKQYLERPNLVFKTSNMSSFIRQLNLYGFRKLNVNRNVRPFDFNTHEEALQFNRERQRLANGEHPITETFYEFQNEYFVKGQKELLCNIKRNIGVRKVKEDIHLNREAFLQSGYFLTKNNDLFHDLYKENMPPGSPITCDHDEKTSDHRQHFPNLTNDQSHQDIAMSSMKTSTDNQNPTNESDSSAGRVRERSLTELLPSLKKQRTQTCMPNDDSIAHTVTSRHQPCSRKSIIECTSVNQDRDRQFSPSTYPNQMCSQTIGIVQETLPILHKQYLEFGENTASRTMAHPATHDDGRSFFKVSSARLGDITENQSISGVGYSSNAYPSTYDFGQYMAHNTSYFDGREYRPGYHCIPMAPISKIKSESIEHSQGGFQANTNWTYMAAPSTPVPHELFMNTAHFSNQRSIQVAGLIPAPKTCVSYTGGGQFQQNSCMYPVPRTFNYSPYPPHQPDPTHSQLPMHLPQSSNHSPDVKNRGPTFEPDVRYLQQFSSSTDIREKNDDAERATKDAMIPIVDVPEGSPMVLRKADFNNLVHAIDKVIKTNPGAWLTFLGLSGLQNSEFATTSIKVLQSLNILVDDSENNDESRHQENYSA